MKYLILFIFIGSISSILTGYFITFEYSQKCIGFGVAALFLLGFPLFSYYRWKDKDIKDYMLTKENFDKMKESQKEKKY